MAGKGLLPTTTMEVARAAGVAHGTVFIHFPTRDALLTEVIREFGATVTRRLHELVDEGGNLQDVLAAHLQGLREFEAFYTRLVMEAGLLPKEARNTLAGIQSTISYHILQAAAGDAATGKIRPLPPHLLFNSWIGLIHYYLINSEYFAPGGSVITRYSDDFLDYFRRLTEI